MISERTDNWKNGYLNSFLNGNQILVYLFCLYTSRRRYKLQILAAKLTITSDVAYGLLFPSIYERIYCQRKNFQREKSKHNWKKEIG